VLKYQLLRSSRRKSIALQISNGGVVVRAPHYVSKEYIEELVLAKKTWIELKLQSYRELNHDTVSQSNSLKGGGILWYKGTPKKIHLSFSHADHISLVDDEINISLKQRWQILPEIALNKKIQTQLELWFKDQAIAVISEKLCHYSQMTQLYPKSVKIRRYKARWGSCNSRDELSFNYLLMMLPEYVFNYVVVHELCHLQYLNHSPKFWQLVADHFPEYNQAKKWLKSHQKFLTWPSI